MTSQSSEQLTIEHPTFRLGDWSVYGVIRGEPTKENPCTRALAPPAEARRGLATDGEARALHAGHAVDPGVDDPPAAEAALAATRAVVAVDEEKVVKARAFG